MRARRRRTDGPGQDLDGGRRDGETAGVMPIPALHVRQRWTDAGLSDAQAVQNIDDLALGGDRSYATTGASGREAGRRGGGVRTARGGPGDWARVVGCFFAAAMIGAPFVALIYSRAAGLAVAAAALGATAYLVLHAVPSIEPERRRAMVLIAIANGVLAVVCLVAFVWMVV